VQRGERDLSKEGDPHRGELLNRLEGRGYYKGGYLLSGKRPKVGERQKGITSLIRGEKVLLFSRRPKRGRYLPKTPLKAVCRGIASVTAIQRRSGKKKKQPKGGKTQARGRISLRGYEKGVLLARKLEFQERKDCSL